MNHLVEPSFQGVNKLFVLAFENAAQRTDIIYRCRNEDCNVMIDGKDFIDQLVKNNKITYENIRKIATGQGDGYATGLLLGYAYFSNIYKYQQTLDADPKIIKQISFTANLDRAENARTFFILEKEKETVLYFS